VPKSDSFIQITLNGAIHMQTVSLRLHQKKNAAAAGFDLALPEG
jgi:hypothetical protein